MDTDTPGKLILLNGASSAGKSTLCRALQAQMPVPFLQFSLDFFMFGHQVLPARRDPEGPFAWKTMRPKLFGGYFGCITALAATGNNLVIDYIIETPEQLSQLSRAVGAFDVFLVGVHCPLPELERRERARGDRRQGDAGRDYQTVHTFTPYDFEVDSTRPADENAAAITKAWEARSGPGVTGGPRT